MTIFERNARRLHRRYQQAYRKPFSRLRPSTANRRLNWYDRQLFGVA